MALSYDVEMIFLCSSRNVFKSVSGFEEILIRSPFDHVIDSVSTILMLSDLYNYELQSMNGKLVKTYFLSLY